MPPPKKVAKGFKFCKNPHYQNGQGFKSSRRHYLWASRCSEFKCQNFVNSGHTDGREKWFGLILLEVMEDRLLAQYQDYFLDEENLKFFSDFNLFGR